MNVIVERIAKPIVFHTANGNVSTHNVAKLVVSELEGVIKLWILESTPAVLSVGYRCMNMGYKFVWPTGEQPYFVLPSGNVVVLEVIDNIPYLRPGSAGSQPRPATDDELRSACSAASRCARGRESGRGCSGDGGTETGSPVAGPASTGGAGSSGDAPPPPPPPPPPPQNSYGEVDPEEIEDEAEAERVLPPNMRRSLKEEASSLHHFLRPKPRNPYCEACVRGIMRNTRKFKGSFVNKAAF